MWNTMFQHPGMALCVMYLALFYARVCLLKESTPSLVLVNLRVFIRRSEHMFLLFRSFLIRSYWLSNGSSVLSEARKMIWPVLLQYLDKVARPSSSFKPSFLKNRSLGFWVFVNCEPFVYHFDACLGLCDELYFVYYSEAVKQGCRLCLKVTSHIWLCL